MALGAGGNCVKYLIFIFNLIFVLTGLIILGLAVWVTVSMNHYVEWLEAGQLFSPVSFIIVGLIIVVVAFFGCCGAAKENYCMVMTFSILLLAIFLVEVGVGVTAYMKRDSLNQYIEKRFNASFAEYSQSEPIRKTFDILQTEVECCGVNGPRDWQGTIPLSCCASLEVGPNNVPETCTMESKFLHRSGCYKKLVDIVESQMCILSGFGIGIAVVQLLGILFGCFLARSINGEYRTV